MTPLQISPDIKLLPAPISKLPELRGLLLKLYSLWISNEFAVGDTLLDESAWGLMKQAIALLPREGGGEWSDLEQFANDYDWIERVFFAQRKTVEGGGQVWRFNVEDFQPSLLVSMHHFDGIRLIREASELLG